MAELKVKAAKDDCIPTRVKAVTALVCKTAMISSKRRTLKNGSSPDPSIVKSHVVNLRSRMVPPLPENSLGNIWWCAAAPVFEEESKKLKMHDLVVQVRKEMRNMDKAFVAKL